jgi:hypothetical protein
VCTVLIELLVVVIMIIVTFGVSMYLIGLN